MEILRSPRPRAFLGVLFAMLVLSQGGHAGAQGFIIPELGSRVNGMGAAIGRPDDLSAIYHNPGALALLPGTQVAISVGVAFLQTSVRLAPWPGSDKFITDPVDSEGYYPEENPSIVAPIPMIGASTHLWSDKLVGGIAIYVPNAAGATFGEDQPSRYHVIDAYLISAFFTAAIAYRPWPWLAVGVGGSAVYIRIQRRSLLYPVINGSDMSGMLGSSTEVLIEGEDVQPAFSLGIQVWPHRTLSVGFMALSRYDVSLEGPLTLKLGSDVDELWNTPELTENQQVTEIVAPWVFAFGANWDITPWLEVGAEFRYYLNSLVEEQRTTISGVILPRFLPDGLVTPKNNHNSFHTGGGFVVRPPLPVKIEILTGMHYESAASPDRTVDVSAPSFELASFHIGARWQATERYRFFLAYSHYWYFERRTTDSITSPPTNFVGSAYTNQVSVMLEARFGEGIGKGK